MAVELLACLTLSCDSSPTDTPCKISPGYEDAALYGGYPKAALPAGSCVGSASCTITVRTECDGGVDGSIQLLFDGYVCSCNGSAWECVDKYPDTAFCNGTSLDAGSE